MKTVLKYLESLKSNDNGNQRQAALAYVAGILDGEGTVRICKGQPKQMVNPSYCVQISCGMTHREPLEVLLALFGGSIRPERVPDGRKPIFRWAVTGRHKLTNVLTEILPYLIVKHDQAIECLNFIIHWQDAPKGGVTFKGLSKIPQQELLRREESYLKVRKLNSVGAAATTKQNGIGNNEAIVWTNGKPLERNPKWILRQIIVMLIIVWLVSPVMAESNRMDLVEITDVVQDTHEDPVLREATDILGEQSAQTVETLRYNVLKAGTNKFYANGTARTDLTTAMNLSLQKKIVRALKRQNAMKITSVVKSTTSFNTESIQASYVAIGHTDLENDIRGMTGFIDAKDYGSTKPFEGEIGAVGDVRYILTNICTSYADAGGAAGSNVSTSGVSADVYPIIFLARDAWAGVALKGAFAITPTVINPTPSKSDPLGQRGSVAWKTMQTAVILNDLWMAVAEVTATDL